MRDRHGLALYGVEYPGYGLAKPGTPTEASIAISLSLYRHIYAYTYIHIHTYMNIILV